MLRAALFTMLIASILGGFLPAQRATPTFHRNSAAGLPVWTGLVSQRGFPNRFLPSRSHLHHDRFGSVFVPYFLPYEEPFGYEQPDAEAVTPQVVILQPEAQSSQTPEPSVPQAKIIEIPRAENSTAAKMLSPTIFILANGERLETRRYMITVSNLFVSINRQQRTFPLDVLDIDATITANHERGIDFRIPADRNEISVSF